MMNPAITALLAIEPQPLAAADLLYRLYVERPPTIEGMLALAPEIEAAIEEANGLAERSRKAIQRCLQLKPSSMPTVPTGF